MSLFQLDSFLRTDSDLEVESGKWLWRFASRLSTLEIFSPHFSYTNLPGGPGPLWYPPTSTALHWHIPPSTALYLRAPWPVLLYCPHTIPETLSPDREIAREFPDPESLQNLRGLAVILGLTGCDAWPKWAVWVYASQTQLLQIPRLEALASPQRGGVPKVQGDLNPAGRLPG